MLVRHPKTFNIGLFLAATFFVVLLLIFSPIFGDGHNGLEYSDALFNKLSKGSSYFIKKIGERTEKFVGTNVALTLNMDKPETAAKAVKVLLTSGAQVGTEGTQLKISADLGRLLGNILNDADAMYYNNGSTVAARYGMDEREVMATWWAVLSNAVKELQKQKKIEEASVVSDVIKKGIEPAYNFYGIEPQSVADKALTMIGLLVFYVAYTMWWGYAIFYMFDGLGLSMKKAKVKKEA